MIVEHWITPHRRAIIIEQEGKRVYSIDAYLNLTISSLEGCHEGPSTGNASLCYIGDQACEAIVSVTPGYTELISIRYYTSVESDPARGDPIKALELCAQRLSRLIGVGVEEILRSPERREG